MYYVNNALLNKQYKGYNVLNAYYLLVLNVSVMNH